MATQTVDITLRCVALLLSMCLQPRQIKSGGLDFYEVAILLGACFLVNYVTADSKTNWAEGFIMVALYLMIVRVVISDVAHLTHLGTPTTGTVYLVLHRPRRDCSNGKLSEYAGGIRSS